MFNYPTPETFQRIRESLKQPTKKLIEFAYFPWVKEESSDIHSAGILADDFLSKAENCKFEIRANIFYTKSGVRGMVLRCVESDGITKNSSLQIIDVSLGKNVITEKILKALESNA